MNLTQIPESIVPEQSVIDLWPQMHRKKTDHAHQDKCSDPKDEPVLQNADEAKFYAAYLEATKYAP